MIDVSMLSASAVKATWRSEAGSLSILTPRASIFYLLIHSTISAYSVNQIFPN